MDSYSLKLYLLPHILQTRTLSREFLYQANIAHDGEM